MNAKRKWNTRTLLLGLIIAVILIAVIFVIFTPPGENTSSPLNVQEVWQNREGYIGERITVEGFYYLWDDGTSSLIPATTVSDPNPDIKIILDEESLNLAKKAAGNITTSNDLKYRVVGVLQQIPLPVGFDVKIIVENIKAV